MRVCFCECFDVDETDVNKRTDTNQQRGNKKGDKNEFQIIDK